MIKVTCRLEDYSEPRKPSILVLSHWCNHGFVVLKINDEEYTVCAEDLIIAVNNATNMGY